MTIRVFARAVARPDRRDELVQALRENMAASLRERGCVGYELAQAVDDPDALTTIEVWRDEAALAEHMRTPHVAALLATVPDLVAAAPEVRSYRVLP